MADEDSEGLDIQALADSMFGTHEPEAEAIKHEGHPAWQEVFSKVPQEYHAALAPVLNKWDQGVSRQFQKIHDSYAPLREFGEYDPEQVREAMGVYEALNNDPSATWEAIGRVYGLSPQQVSQVISSNDDVEDTDMIDELPQEIRDRLAQLDMHEQVLDAVTNELLQRQAHDKEAQEDAELDEYIEALHQEYGEFDENYVVGLIASGIDGAEAVQSFYGLVNDIRGTSQQQQYPEVMSSGGGIPSLGEIDTSKLSNQDTQNLIAEMLRMTNDA